ncbi:MAG TPA: FHA domain-containing protein [Kofleriaceae bacterium]|nr:FHA domain-containing protein [Kofleriaceae bacterium]
MPKLYIEYLGDSIELPRGETVVGREVGCALRFNDPSISRRHMRFVRRVDEVFVEDLRSSNGTLLNGRAVTAPMRIGDGDIITVGSRTLTVRSVDSDDIELPSTLVLADAKPPRDPAAARAPTVTNIDIGRSITKRIQSVKPETSNQRCPQCAAPVSETDDECSSCHYVWGFGAGTAGRPMTPTHVAPNPLDRRRHDRHSMELPLIYVSSELEIEATTRDLSHSGVFVSTQILDPIGTQCQLTILIDGGPALRVSGVVRRVVTHNDRGEPVGLGVELHDLGESERSWIDVAVQRMSEGVV